MTTLNEFLDLLRRDNADRAAAQAAADARRKAMLIWSLKWIGAPLAVLAVALSIIMFVRADRWWNARVTEAWQTGAPDRPLYPNIIRWGGRSVHSDDQRERFRTILQIPYENNTAPQGCINGNVFVFRNVEGQTRIKTHERNRQICVSADASLKMQRFIDRVRNTPY